MAASNHDSTLRPLFQTTESALPPNLPNGACGYRELGQGIQSPICGCKQFWLNSSDLAAGSSDNASCFCGHHACFHAFVSQPIQRISTQNSANAIFNDLLQQPSVPARITPERYGSVRPNALPPHTAGLGIRPDSKPQSQSINTRVWDALNAFARGQEHGEYSVHTSQLPSTAVSVNGDVEQPIVPVQPLTTRTAFGASFEGSATEVNTPSLNGTPDPNAFNPAVQPRFSPRRPQPSVVPPPAITLWQPTVNTAQIKRPPEAVKEIHQPDHQVMEILKTQAHRIEALETTSFVYVSPEELQDKFDLLDDRILDLEQWRMDRQEDNTRRDLAGRQIVRAMKRQRRALPHESMSFASDDSLDEMTAAHVEATVLATISADTEIGRRLTDLEQRMSVAEQAAIPTPTNPWNVQVVLLPWGKSLRGIWFSAMDATHQERMSIRDNDEWMAAQSRAKTSFRTTTSSESAAWTTESIQAWADDTQDWLSAKACGPAGAAFRRLESKGLIRNVTITSTESRHILDVLRDAFDHVLPKQHATVDGYYQALSEAYIPLRKVQKSTRLRFLSPAEMITSATWSATCLDSSIVMKRGGERRLYITTPQAYVQESEGFTWQQLRRLPPRDHNGEEPASQIDESVAIEACWSYNEKLDRTASLHNSFTSQPSALRTKSQSSKDATNGPITPAFSGSEGRMIHLRTTSLPSSTSAREGAKDAAPKRRVASFEDATVPIIAKEPVDATKRRRLSNAHEAEHRGVNFTPRYSREPPSPYHLEHAVEARGSGAASGSRKRGITPVAYATPHSNSHYMVPYNNDGDGDTEHDSDLYQGLNLRYEDEEWQGMDATAEISPEQELAEFSNAEDEEEEE